MSPATAISPRYESQVAHSVCIMGGERTHTKAAPGPCVLRLKASVSCSPSVLVRQLIDFGAARYQGCTDYVNNEIGTLDYSSSEVGMLVIRPSDLVLHTVGTQ
jgi:hypothetical protein